MKAIKKTLKNGVRVLTVPMKDNPAVTVMVVAGAGSNNENETNKGVAHFLEHMCFKGGETYTSAREVSGTLDALGAKSNAGTGHEYTAYYAKGNPKHVGKILDVVSDIYLNSRIPEDELEKERGVILEEINMYNDLPRAQVEDLFFETLYGDQPAGWHTLGTKESIKSMTRDTFVDFKKKQYTSTNTLIVVAGQVDQKNVISEVKKRFESVPMKKHTKRSKTKERQDKPKLQYKKKTTGQTHMMIGVRTCKASDKNVPTLELLAGVLGYGMSSRLFSRLREDMGVCYYVKTDPYVFTDHGFLAISAGVDNKRVGEVTHVILEEFQKLKDELVGDEELKKVKEYVVSTMYLGLEESIGVADFYMEQELVEGEITSPRQKEKALRSVTAKDIRNYARRIFRDKGLNMAIVGTIKDEKELKKLLRFA